MPKHDGVPNPRPVWDTSNDLTEPACSACNQWLVELIGCRVPLPSSLASSTSAAVIARLAAVPEISAAAAVSTQLFICSSRLRQAGVNPSGVELGYALGVPTTKGGLF